MMLSEKIGAYLINLDRATERLNFVMPSIAALGFQITRISAVDGQTLSLEEINSLVDVRHYKIAFKMFPEVGTIGCSLSHKKAWLSFLESNNEFAIIFEDDVQFDPQELRETIELAIEKKSLWDIVNFETLHRGCPLKISELASGKHLVVYLTNVTHAGCYLINRRAAQEMLKKFHPIKMPVDHYFTTTWELGLRFVGVEPRIVHQKFGNSQIKTSNAVKSKNPVILVANILYQGYRATMCFVYNLMQKFS